jgi:hypothetical protein
MPIGARLHARDGHSVRVAMTTGHGNSSITRVQRTDTFATAREPPWSVYERPAWVELIPESIDEGAIGLTVLSVLPQGDMLIWGG